MARAIDVADLRKRLGLSQAKFARAYGLTLAAVLQWEHGRRQPRGTAAVLLRLIEREPETIRRILAEEG